MRHAAVRGLRGWIGIATLVLAVAGATPLGVAPTASAAPAALSGAILLNPGGYSLPTPPTQADLSAAGTTDWAIWGWGAGGSSTSLAPDVRKAGGTEISDLTDLEPGAPIAL